MPIVNPTRNIKNKAMSNDRSPRVFKYGTKPDEKVKDKNGEMVWYRTGDIVEDESGKPNVWDEAAGSFYNEDEIVANKTGGSVKKALDAYKTSKPANVGTTPQVGTGATPPTPDPEITVGGDDKNVGSTLTSDKKDLKVNITGTGIGTAATQGATTTTGETAGVANKTDTTQAAPWRGKIYRQGRDGEFYDTSGQKIESGNIAFSKDDVVVNSDNRIFGRNEGNNAWDTVPDNPNNPGIKGYNSYMVDPNRKTIDNAAAPEQSPKTLLDATVPQVVELSPQYQMLNKLLTAENADPTKIQGFNALTDARKVLDSGVDAENALRNNLMNTGPQDFAIQALKDAIGGKGEVNRALIKSIKDMMNAGYDNKYYNDTYNSVAGTLQGNAADERARQEADLRSKGLGFSTVVGDQNAVTDRLLNQQLGEKAAWAAKNAAEMQQKDQQFGTTAGQVYQGQNAENAKTMAGIGSDTMKNIESGSKSLYEMIAARSKGINDIGIGQNNLVNNSRAGLGALGTWQEGNTALNLGLGKANRQEHKENLDFLLGLPYKTAASGNAASGIAGQTSDNIYNAAMTNYGNTQKDIGTLLSGWLTKAKG